MSGGETVKVLVRCRPLNSREKGLGCSVVVEMDNSIGQVSLIKPDAPNEPPKQFSFDGVFGIDSCTRQIYEDLAFPLVENVLEGYNGTIFAYGQTGCGKSFSMEGIADSADHRGITPRAFEQIFQEVAVRENTKFLVRASYLEIYNEQIRDLLTKNYKNALEVKEHPEKGVYVKDLSQIVVHSTKEILDLMAKGSQNRSVGATAMNADSSRSHSIFTVWVEMCSTDGGEDKIRASKLNLVDLAGSERQSKTQAAGDRLKEATKINLSLSALGNVISALVDGKAKHIPYRDSKLTRLLQDSLGGNTKTMMVACCSPADNNYDETLSTLRYANRAKNIQNKAKINEDPKDALIREYQAEIQKLKQMLLGMIPVEVGSAGLSALPAASSTTLAKPKPVKTSSAPKIVTAPETSSFDEETLQRIKDEKEAELSEMERNLRINYDNKLAELTDMYNQAKLSNEKLEEEFERLTKKYEIEKGKIQDEYDHMDEAVKVEAAIQKRRESGADSSSEPRVKSKIPQLMNRSKLPRRAVVVLDSEGRATQAIKDSDGRLVKVTVNDDGEVEVKKDADGHTEVLAAQGNIEVVHYQPVAVVGPDFTPVVGVIGSDNFPVVAHLDPITGRLVPKLDENGEMQVILGPGGLPASQVVVTNSVQRQNEAHLPAVSVVDARGRVVQGVKRKDGKIVKARVNAKGRLVPLRRNALFNPSEDDVILDSSGKPALEIKFDVNDAVTVVAEDGTPVMAMLNEKGEAVNTTIDGEGRLCPMKDKDGSTQVILDTSGKPSTRIVETSEHVFVPIVVVGENGEAVPAVLGKDGLPLRADIGENGLLFPVLDNDGKYQVITGPDGKPAQTVKSDPTPVPALNAQGEQVLGVIQEDGTVVQATFNEKHELIPLMDQSGETITVEATNDGEPLSSDMLANLQLVSRPSSADQTLNGIAPGDLLGAAAMALKVADPRPAQDSAPSSPQPPQQQQTAPAVANGIDPAVVQQLLEKLHQLENNVVVGGDQAKNEELKTSLVKRRKKAEEKQLSRLRKAKEADDDSVLEEIYGNMQDEIRAKTKKLNKMKESLDAAQKETEDLKLEYQEEKYELMEAVRKQDQTILFYQQMFEKIQPLIRRDCNYSNFDKIRAASQFDEDLGVWLLPKVLTDRQDSPGLDTADERLRDRLSEGGDPEYFKSKRQEQLLQKYANREAELNQTLDTKLSRFDKTPPTSQRSLQLLQQDPLLPLERSRSGGKKSDSSSMLNPASQQKNSMMLEREQRELSAKNRLTKSRF